MRWFGKEWKCGQECAVGREIPHPTGAICCHCEEAIGPEDSGMQYPDDDYAHRNCYLRMVLGPVAHIEKRCGCYVPGSEEHDPPGMTLRQAADAAVIAYEKKMRLRVN